MILIFGLLSHRTETHRKRAFRMQCGAGSGGHTYLSDNTNLFRRSLGRRFLELVQPGIPQHRRSVRGQAGPQGVSPVQGAAATGSVCLLQCARESATQRLLCNCPIPFHPSPGHVICHLPHIDLRPLSDNRLFSKRDCRIATSASPGNLWEMQVLGLRSGAHDIPVITPCPLLVLSCLVSVECRAQPLTRWVWSLGLDRICHLLLAV